MRRGENLSDDLLISSMDHQRYSMVTFASKPVRRLISTTKHLLVPCVLVNQPDIETRRTPEGRRHCWRVSEVHPHSVWSPRIEHGSDPTPHLNFSEGLGNQKQ